MHYSNDYNDYWREDVQGYIDLYMHEGGDIFYDDESSDDDDDWPEDIDERHDRLDRELYERRRENNNMPRAEGVGSPHLDKLNKTKKVVVFKEIGSNQVQGTINNKIISAKPDKKLHTNAQVLRRKLEHQKRAESKTKMVNQWLLGASRFMSKFTSNDKTVYDKNSGTATPHPRTGRIHQRQHNVDPRDRAGTVHRCNQDQSKIPCAKVVKRVSMGHAILSLLIIAMVGDTNALPKFKDCDTSVPPYYAQLPVPKICIKLDKKDEPVKSVVMQVWGTSIIGNTINGISCSTYEHRVTCWRNFFGVEYITDDTVYNVPTSISM